MQTWPWIELPLAGSTLLPGLKKVEGPVHDLRLRAESKTRLFITNLILKVKMKSLLVAQASHQQPSIALRRP